MYAKVYTMSAQTKYSIAIAAAALLLSPGGNQELHLSAGCANTGAFKQQPQNRKFQSKELLDSLKVTQKTS